MLCENNHMPGKTNHFEILKLIYSKGKIYLLLPVMTDYTLLPPNFTSHYHIHPVYHVIFVLNGQGFLELTNTRVLIKAKDIVFVNPMEKHIFKTKDEYLNYFTINFYLVPILNNTITVEQIISLFLRNANQIKHYAETEKLQNIINIQCNRCFIRYNTSYWKSMEQDIISFRSGVDDYINAFRFNSKNEQIFFIYLNKTFDFFSRMLSRYLCDYQAYDINNCHDDILIQKIKNYLENNLDKNLDLKHMAKELGYNSSYLSNYFSTKMKLTISEYFNKLKIKKACEYLKHTDKSIIDISNILGYNSPQYFSRVFKAAKNITPREYRNNIEIY